MLALIAALVMMIILILRDPWPGQPASTVYKGFEPQRLFANNSNVTFHSSDWQGTFNPAVGWGIRRWHGVIEAPPGHDLPVEFCTALENHLRLSVPNCMFHWRLDFQGLAPVAPRHTEVLYNQGPWHGGMNIWLFPDASGQKMSYAIYLREEPLTRRGPIR